MLQLFRFILLSFILILTSCSQISYLSEQGFAQMKIQWSGEKVHEVVKRTDISPEHKRKIHLIIKAKKFFYDYLKEEEAKIYREVVFLKQDAVTYLVTASYFNEVKPKNFSFPFMGSFPYIGFFNQKSALAFARKLDKDDYYTYVRPVYAYSTLGYFEDKILSSFFYLDDISLVETIYHELFHTVFFIKDSVDLNENLANFFAQKMLEKTDFLDSEKILEHFKEQEIQEKVVQKVVQLVQEYSFRLKNEKPAKKVDADITLKNFTDQILRPKILEECIVQGLKTTRCTLASRQWNNASFSAFLTYEKDQYFWQHWWRKQMGMTPKVFLGMLRKNYESFEDENEGHKNFEDYLKNKIKI